jgi:2-methylisocitrate lyase-like PEP mutase family enzyme
MSKSALLRGLLTSPGTLVMPDAYDPLSARIIESLGFKSSANLLPSASLIGA